MPRRLHIIRHADVVIDEKAQATDWSLSPDAEGDVVGLLDRFDPSPLRRVITSREKKAIKTGQILAKALGLPIEVRQGLEDLISSFSQAQPTIILDGDNIGLFGRVHTACTLTDNGTDNYYLLTQDGGGWKFQSTSPFA